MRAYAHARGAAPKNPKTKKQRRIRENINHIHNIHNPVILRFSCENHLKC